MKAIIGGTGLNQWARGEALSIAAGEWGPASGPIYRIDGGLFMARHGDGHHTPPHRINYRANIAALKAAGATDIVAVNAVGGITRQASTGALVLPHDLIDYTWGREPSFYDGGERGVEHIDFTQPFDAELRQAIANCAASIDQPLVAEGVYAVTQGPRLETAAEVRRLANDGCSVVGMTAMPEAALARELGMAYCSLCLVVNPAAGLSDQIITMDDIRAVVAEGMDKVEAVLKAWLAA